MVVWRSWILAPPPRNGYGKEPVLTGTQGFPWWAAELEAKCTQQDRDDTVAGFATFRVDRHHPAIPEANCTCGIYAHRDELTRPASLWQRQPMVSGFVELTGRRIETVDGFRSQHARMIGPLRLRLPGPPPWLGLASSGQPEPRRIVTGPRGFKVLWRRGRAGLPVHVWEEQMRRGIAARYGIPLLMLRPAPA